MICPVCDAPDAKPGTVCPKSVKCPSCHANPGTACVRPSGHRAASLHMKRVFAAEWIDYCGGVGPDPRLLNVKADGAEPLDLLELTQPGAAIEVERHPHS